MPENNLFQDSKAFVSSMLRSLDFKRAGGDVAKLKEIGEQTDDETLRKWLWMAAIVSAPVCFIALPVGLCLFGFLSGFLINALWFVAKIAMALVIILFAFAAYLTWRQEGK